MLASMSRVAVATSMEKWQELFKIRVLLLENVADWLDSSWIYPLGMLLKGGP